MMNDFAASAGMTRPSVQVPLLDRMLVTEVTGDFSLPDYQPEIKRLLRIGVGVLPPTCTGSGRDTEMSGALDYYVLYMGHDNALWCAPLSTEYRLSVPVEDNLGDVSAGEPFVCLGDVTTEAPVGRVTAPRRLSIRCKVQAHVRMYGECLLQSEEGSGEDVEVLTGHGEVARTWRTMGEMIPLQDDILLPMGGAERRVVCAEGSVMMQEAIPADGGVHLRGEVTVKLTVTPEESAAAFASDEITPVNPTPVPEIIRRKIPFSATVELDGVTPTCAATACGYCTDLSVQMEEGQLHVDLGVIPEVRAQRNEPVTYVKDLYSTRHRLSTRHATLPTEKGCRAINGNFTLSDSLPLSEMGMEPDATIVDVTATAMPEALAVDASKGRCVLSGKCLAHLLLLRDGEYASSTMELPFRYEFDDTDAVSDGTSFDGSVTVLHCRGRSDGERASFDAELAVSLRTHASAPVTALSDTVEDTSPDRTARRRGEYVVCFPAPTDSLWSVAKRYHAPMTALTAANNLPSGVPADAPESLSDVKYLIV